MSFYFRLLCLILLVAGLAVSGHLMSRRLSLADSSAQAGDICADWLGADCDAALQSPYSHQLGLSLPAWGLVYYATSLCLLLLAWLLSQQLRTETALAGMLLAGAGFMVSLVLLGLMITGAAPWCPLCVLLHAVNLVLVFAWWPVVGLRPAEIGRALLAGGRFLVTGRAADPREARWKVVAMILPAASFVVFYQWAFIQEQLHQRKAPQFDPQRVLAEFSSATQEEIPIRADDPALGPPDAPVVMVVFSDFQCPACRRLARRLRALTAHRPSKLRIIYRHWPLSSQCNSAVRSDKHPLACNAARAAEAARRQEKFWPYFDALLSGAATGDEPLNAAAQQVGLDLETFHHDIQQGSVAERIADDISLGSKLGVRATPTVFINGRRLVNHRDEALELIIDHELHKIQSAHAAISH